MSSVPALTKWRAASRLEKQDVRELRRLLEQQKQALREVKSELLEQEPLAGIGEMAQFIFHDIRQHLSAVYAGVEFLSNADTRPPDREELLKDVGTAIHTMTGLLDSLILFAQTGRAVHRCPGSLNLVIEHAVAMLRTHPDAADVRILVKDMPLMEGWIDGRRLGSAIYNLLLNACQAARRGPAPSRIELTLSEDESLIHIRVIDSGPGVPDSIRETLFRPFVSGGNGNTIGLGLSIAERAARGHGGLVCLEESRPGRTVFCLQLPRLALGSAAAESTARAVLPRRRPKRNSSHTASA